MIFKLSVNSSSLLLTTVFFYFANIYISLFVHLWMKGSSTLIRNWWKYIMLCRPEQHDWYRVNEWTNNDQQCEKHFKNLCGISHYSNNVLKKWKLRASIKLSNCDMQYTMFAKSRKTVVKSNEDESTDDLNINLKWINFYIIKFYTFYTM